MADKRYQDELIALHRRHLKKYKRRRALEEAQAKTKLSGNIGVAFASTAQAGPT